MKETFEFLTRLMLCMALTVGAIALVSEAANSERAFAARYQTSNR
jgi:hypothetical protein